jgi:hypothetical protein
MSYEDVLHVEDLGWLALAVEIGKKILPVLVVAAILAGVHLVVSQ